MFLAVGLIPGILAQQVGRQTVVPAGYRTRPAAVFPFRIGRQPVSGPHQYVGRYPHPLNVAPRAGLVAPLVPGDPLLLAQPVAIGGRRIPGAYDRRTARIRSVAVQNAGRHTKIGVGLGEPLELLDRHLPVGDGEPAGEGHAWGRLVREDRFALGGGRAHANLDRPADDGEGLSLAIDEPTAVAPVLELGQLGVVGLELLVEAPLPQGPS